MHCVSLPAFDDRALVAPRVSQLCGDLLTSHGIAGSTVIARTVILIARWRHSYKCSDTLALSSASIVVSRNCAHLQEQT